MRLGALGAILMLTLSAAAADIHDAVRAGDPAKIKTLIAKDPTAVHEKDGGGRTPLHFAAGADPNARNGRGANALDSAFYGRRPEAVEVLLRGGLRVETKGDEGRVLLHRAAAIDLPAPRATTSLDGKEIFTVNGEHNDVPEVAYLVIVDGLAIYHSGDYTAPLDGFRGDMDYLLHKAGAVDLAFIGKFPQAEALKPRVVVPIHAFNREFMYGAFAREAAEKKLPSRVILPENKGDRFIISK